MADFIEHEKPIEIVDLDGGTTSDKELSSLQYGKYYQHLRPTLGLEINDVDGKIARTSKRKRSQLGSKDHFDREMNSKLAIFSKSGSISLSDSDDLGVYGQGNKASLLSNVGSVATGPTTRAPVRELSYARSSNIQLPLTAENLQAIDATAGPDNISFGGAQAFASVKFRKPYSRSIRSRSPALSQKMTRRQRQRMRKLAKFSLQPDKNTDIDQTEILSPLLMQKVDEEIARVREDGQDCNRRLGKLNRQVAKGASMSFSGIATAKNDRFTKEGFSRPCFPSSIQHRPNKRLARHTRGTRTSNLGVNLP